jgi:hypothetical protein
MVVTIVAFVLDTVVLDAGETVVVYAPGQMYRQVGDDCVADPVDSEKKILLDAASKIQLNPNAAGMYLVEMPFIPTVLTALPKHSDELDTSARPTSSQVIPVSRNV